MQPPNQPLGQPQMSPQTSKETSKESGGDPAPGARPPGPRVDASRLWAGGITTAAIAGLTAVFSVLLVRGVLGFPVLAPDGHGALGDASAGLLAAGSAVVALAATAVLHLLMLSTAQAGRFFAWIVALITAGVVLLPFTSSVSTEAKVGTGVVRLAIGVAIGSLLSAVCRGAGRRAA
ncbi:DUF6069 family protein [Streptomyces sp. NPDC059862]|uniref:DUF6069 family protein n=1 Tax=Streptomyces sp. NPDC059862 TaxID=3346975 RepID=UPI00365ED36D